MDKNQLAIGIAEKERHEKAVKSLNNLERQMANVLGEQYRNASVNTCRDLPKESAQILTLANALIANWKEEENLKHQKTLASI